MRPLRAARRPGHDDGSIAVELSIVMPLMLLLLALVYGYGRVSQVSGALEAGTRDGARAASQARDATGAQQAAEQAVRSSLTVSNKACLSTLQVRLAGGVFKAGFPVTVLATCSYPLSTAGLPGAPGSIDAEASFTSPVDPNRGVR